LTFKSDSRVFASTSVFAKPLTRLGIVATQSVERLSHHWRIELGMIMDDQVAMAGLAAFGLRAPCCFCEGIEESPP
jgi:hypothetical protein